MMHSALGGTYALASKGNVAIGMLAGGMGEALSGLTSPESSAHAFSGTGESGTGLSNWNDTIVAATAMLAGGSASDISTATTISSSVVEYNRRLHEDETYYLSLAKESKSPEEQERLDAAALRAVGGEKGLESIDPQRLRIASMVNKAEDYAEEHELLKKIAIEHGHPEAFEYGKLDAIKDFVASHNRPITQATNSIVAGVGVQSMKGLIPLISSGNPYIAGVSLAVTGWYTSESVERVIMPSDPIEGERVLQSLKEKTPSYTKEKGKELALNVFAAGVMRSVKGIASNAGKIYDKAERFFGKTNASKTTLPPSNTNSNNSIVKIIEKNTGAYKDKKYIFSQKKLASYLQSNEPHRIIAQGKEFRDVDRIIKTYGGSKKDWVKMSSSKTNISGSDLHFETHWVQNIKTGQKVEIKTVKVKGNWYVEQ